MVVARTFYLTWSRVAQEEIGRMLEFTFGVLKLIETVIRIIGMVYPTIAAAFSRGRKTRKSRSRAIASPRRTKVRWPRIYVQVATDTVYPRYALAHLRNKKGYLYLSWRDGKKIRTRYLGKTSRAYPTPAARSEPGLPAAAAPRRAGRRDRA